MVWGWGEKHQSDKVYKYNNNIYILSVVCEYTMTEKGGKCALHTLY